MIFKLYTTKKIGFEYNFVFKQNLTFNTEYLCFQQYA